MSEVIKNIIGFILVALCWGFTNPFIKLGTKGIEEVEQQYTGWKRTYKRTIWLLTRWQYIVPLALNLSGSLVFYYTLGKSDISLAVPISNSLTFVFTTIAGKFLGEPFGGAKSYFALGLVMAGVTLCVLSKL
ncbi:UPF0546 membrane protein C1orf91 [Neocallimastix lanati (nom. inval.)]|jgi:drug/metabolite transporter (DMT)-like permease|uniref:UPF0546 membrane protein C1orf91 n=1 Tax=Neocallimastix californiae TaxID=1754190 RepID=A0A1Y2CS77_9FUNG|nr:UPF0546 membrane protein C1orf91 [Neocallimastix sp. JGI-2020a]ORY49225.1 UPF0546 membrane protein C1orf91 [Neocallimastix californiae]|eukprot:ORY49225.1 UPF0546 membrane protein C1orf91 [Neocallimastix californiae]